MKKVILLCSLLSFSLYGQKIDSFERIEVDGFYTNPLFSPTGEFVLLTGEHLKGVYLLDMERKSVQQISDREGSGYAYSWDSTGEWIYFREKPERGNFSDSKVISYNIRDHHRQQNPAISHNYLPSYKGPSKDDSQVVVYTNINTLKIEAMDLGTSKQWLVTNDEGQFYNALLSNSGTKVAVHNGADIYVYDIEGSTGKKIGTGIATAWTADDNYLIGFLDESEDGHVVTNSELYLFDVERASTVKLTDTEIISEMFPTIHEDKVIFSDDKTGRLFIATLKY